MLVNLKLQKSIRSELFIAFPIEMMLNAKRLGIQSANDQKVFIIE